MGNVYFSPEEFGLVVVVEAEGNAEGYGFDLTVVWKEVKSGKLYWAHDSGCSCPSPFEDYVSVDMLNPLSCYSHRASLEAAMRDAGVPYDRSERVVRRVKSADPGRFNYGA